MKPSEILRENVNPQLLQYVSNLDNISRPQDNLAVFVWTNKNLKNLLKHGLNAGQELDYITTPNDDQAGLGIINLATNEAAVGAIDRDGGVFIVSSLDDENTNASAFMKSVQSPKARKLFSRLEQLETLFNDRERDKKKSKKSSGDFMDDLLDANSDLEDPVDEKYLELETDDPKEAKKELQQRIKDLEKDKSSASIKKDKLNKIIHSFNFDSMSEPEIDAAWQEYGVPASDLGDKIRYLENSIKSLNQLIKDNPELFKLRKKVEKDDEEIDNDTDQIDQWLDSLLKDFPGLEISDADIFNPNPEFV